MTALFIVSGGSVLFVGAPPATDVAAQTHYVRVGFLQDFSFWNPLNIEMVSDYVACYLMFSVLFQYDENWEGPVNDLATGYYQILQPSGNMTTIINITDTAYFRNAVNPLDTSHPLTAEDVEFTIETILANPGGAWDSYLVNITGVNMTDTYQIAIDTSYPKATLIDDLVWIPILPKFQWIDIASNKILTAKDPDWLIGSGPFYFEEMVFGSWYKFAKAPNYHGSTDYPDSRVVDVDGIIYTIYTDASGMVTEMNAGMQDVIDVSGEPNLFLDTLGVGSAVPITKQVTNEMGIIDIAINAIPMEFRTPTYGNGNTLLLDYYVREAIAMTLNKQFIAEDLLLGLPTMADSVIHPGYWHNDIEPEVPYDPAGAKTLLEAHGYDDVDTDNILEATASAYPVVMGWADEGDELTFALEAPDTDPSYPTIGNNWVGWAAQAGINFEYATKSESIMVNIAWYKATYDLWIWSWYWSPEPLSNLAVWKTSQMRPGGDNCQMPMGPWYFNEANSSTGVAYSAYDENFSEAQRTLNMADRKVIVDRLQQFIYDSRTELPPVYPNGLYAFSNDQFTGWGNWTQHVGRSIASDLPWLWFDLQPTGANQMPVFETTLGSDYTVVIDNSQEFIISVYDPEGDPLSVEWSFGDGATATNSSSTGTSSPVTFRQSHTYTALATGGLDMTVNVSDGTPGNVAISRATVYVIPVPDSIPTLTTPVLSDPPDRAYVSDPVEWMAGAKDAESGGTDGYGLRFTWDWDDGTYNSTLYYPTTDNVEQLDVQSHSWDAEGTYNIELFVWDGSDLPGHNVSMGVIQYEIVVNQPPEVPVISPINTTRNVEVECVATSTDVDEDDLRFTWEWDDGTFTVQDVPFPETHTTVYSTAVHTWTAQGTYPVTVWVDDMNGHNVSSTIGAVVGNTGAEAPPSSLLLVADPNPSYPGGDVVFNASAVDVNSDPLTMYIDFGDGNASVNTTAGGATTRQWADEFGHAYESAGDYTVTLYADDESGLAGHNVSISMLVSVTENSPPWLVLPLEASAYYNTTFTLTPSRVRDNDTADALQVWYDWGDGEWSQGSLPYYAGNHTYLVSGQVTVTVYADDGTGLAGHNVSGEVNVTINENLRPEVEGAILKTPSKTVYEPGETITFTITVSDYEGDTVNITVDFGDGSPVEKISNVDLEPENHTVRTVNHTFEEAADDPYVVTVTVDDGMMQFHSVKTWNSQTVTVDVPKEDGGAGDLALYVGIAAILIIAAIVVALLLMRKKKGPGEEKLQAGGDMEGMAPPPEPPAKP